VGQDGNGLTVQFILRLYLVPSLILSGTIPLLLETLLVAQLVDALYYKPEGRGFDS
jgi:hypothetical protein